MNIIEEFIMKNVLKATVITLGVVLAAPVLAAGDYCEYNAAIKTQFKQLDSDSDGFINKAEVNAQPELVKNMNVYGGDNFAMGDIDADGVLSWNEFLANEEVISAE